MNLLPYTAVKVTDPFWADRIRLVCKVVLPYQWEMLNDRVEGAVKSHCILNFKAAAGETEYGHYGTVFLDTDLYKWLEAVAYALAVEGDAALEALADQAVELIIGAQQADGYINTYYTLNAPQKRFSNLMEGHELYCAGHMFEAAVAYKQATGKGRLLDAALRFADCISRTFALRAGYPGHPEVELALIRLYEETGEKRCLDLAEHFLNARGAGESVFNKERTDPAHDWIWHEMQSFDDAYFQAHRPVRDQTTAEGHAVRAMYLYSAMADAARLTGDTALGNACATLFANTTERRMYVTGGIGSAALGERFTSDWDLPNDTMYCETCASIGLMMFARRMLLLTGDARFYDIWERSLCNTVQAGMGEDGKHYFYVNPLEVKPEIIHGNPTFAHVKAVRQSWFGVACCPPNVARTLTSLGGSLYAKDGDALYILAHIASEAVYNGYVISLKRTGSSCCLRVIGEKTRLRLRIPEGVEFVPEHAGEFRYGYWEIAHPGGEAEYCYSLAPFIRLVHTNPKVSANAGKACLMRGAQVYCMEEADNGTGLSALYLQREARFREEPAARLPEGVPLIKADGLRMSDGVWKGGLYTEETPVFEPCEICFTPYGLWGNRGEGEMQVYVNVL
jgi:uncharacterized protein